MPRVFFFAVSSIDSQSLYSPVKVETPEDKTRHELSNLASLPASTVTDYVKRNLAAKKYVKGMGAQQSMDGV